MQSRQSLFNLSLVLALSACAPQDVASLAQPGLSFSLTPTPTPVMPTPSATPSAQGMEAPTPSPKPPSSPLPASTVPSASWSTGALPTPSATDTPRPTPRCDVYWGTVKDEFDQPVEGAKVQVIAKHIEGGETTTLRDETIATIAGAWRVEGVPAGPSILVYASRPGWTRRVLVSTNMYWGCVFQIAFGQPDGSLEDTRGRGLFLSNYPEVAGVDLVGRTYSSDYSKEGVAPSNVVLKLKFSEPMDGETRNRLANAVRLWPVAEGVGTTAAPDLSQPGYDDASDGLAGADIDFSNDAGSVTPEGTIDATPGGRARATWDSDGSTMTLAIDGLLGSGEKESYYQVGIVSDGALFADSEGLALGTNHGGIRNKVPPPGRLLANVFFWDGAYGLWLEPSTSSDRGRLRWNATHSAAFTFRVWSAASPGIPYTPRTSL